MVDFEAQDEGYVAKMLIGAGSGEVKCDTPILVTVQDAADVAAFGDYVVELTALEPVVVTALPTQTPALTPTPAAGGCRRPNGTNPRTDADSRTAAGPRPNGGRRRPRRPLGGRVFASPLRAHACRGEGVWQGHGPDDCGHGARESYHCL
jgi:pyruvate/2-oxoglutarate dehydrogenase complex dihydrolipoamide acyltransferase (E2) component